MKHSIWKKQWSLLAIEIRVPQFLLSWIAIAEVVEHHFKFGLNVNQLKDFLEFSCISKLKLLSRHKDQMSFRFCCG